MKEMKEKKPNSFTMNLSQENYDTPDRKCPYCGKKTKFNGNKLICPYCHKRYKNYVIRDKNGVINN